MICAVESFQSAGLQALKDVADFTQLQACLTFLGCVSGCVSEGVCSSQDTPALLLLLLLYTVDCLLMSMVCMLMGIYKQRDLNLWPQGHANNMNMVSND